MGEEQRKPETPYTETELLLAVLNGDEARIQELLNGMTANELRNLRIALMVLYGKINNNGRSRYLW